MYMTTKNIEYINPYSLFNHGIFKKMDPRLSSRGVIFRIGDKVRLCNGLNWKQYDKINNNNVIPNVNDDTSIGKFAIVLQIVNELGENQNEIMVDSISENKFFLKIDILSSSFDISYSNEQKIAFVGMESVINYSIMDKENADIIFENSKDKNVEEIFSMMSFQSISLPKYLEETTSVCDYERISVKCQFLRSFIHNTYYDILEDIRKMNSDYRMESMCFFANLRNK
jgi:hypothetical protein